MLTLLRRAEVFSPCPAGDARCPGGGRQIWRHGAELEAPRGVEVDEVDLDGVRLVPGLIDAHVHLTGGGGESGPASRVPPVTLATLARPG